MPALVASLLWHAFLALALTLAAAWGTLALWFRGPQPVALTVVAIALWLLLALTALAAMFIPALRAGYNVVFIAAGLGFAGLWLWWSALTPQQHRDWAPDVGRLLAVERDGDAVTLHNVRDFVWRTPEDFTPHWETRHYDIAQLRTVDLIASYWRGPAIAHTLVSFGFADGRYLVFSVEVRRTRGQTVSALGGLFKQTELALVAADERDIVRTRSNARGESVYLYRVGLPRPQIRSLFRAYLDEAESLQRRPRFYNTIFSNCTTLVYDMVKRIVPGIPWDRRLLLSGYLPEYLYELDALDTSRPFAELQARGHINTRALATDHAPLTDFSQAIRRGVPAPDGSLIAPLSWADHARSNAMISP